MNGSAANFTSFDTNSADLVQELYLNYVKSLSDVCMLTLLTYTTMLSIAKEMEYMWSSPNSFSVTTVLYAFTRYGVLIVQALAFWIDFLSAGSLCNTVANVQLVAHNLTYVGVQGLLVSRAYSLCHGNRIIAGTLAFAFSAGLVLSIYLDILDPGCAGAGSATAKITFGVLAANICNCLTDLLVFCVCMWKVWSTWKLKRDIGIQNYNDLVSVLLAQTVSRFCFVITFTVATTILYELAPLLIITSPVDILISLQHSFSTMLLANFVLDLRRRNSAAIKIANITLPTIEITSVMSYIHESILVEMGDHGNTSAREGDGGDELLSGPSDVEVECESA